MKNSLGIWTLGVVASVALNIGATAGLMAALNPQTVPKQETPQSRVNVTAQDVTRSDAVAQDPPAQETATQEGDATALRTGAIAQSVARPLQAPAQQTQASVPQTETTRLQSPQTPVTAPRAPALTVAVRADPSEQQAPSRPVTNTGAPAKPLQTVPAQPADLVVTATLQPSQTLLAPAPQPSSPILAAMVQPAASPPSTTLRATQSQPPAANEQKPEANVALTVTLDLANAAAVAPVSIASPPKTPENVPAPAQQPQVTEGKAMLAFPKSGAVDPVSLAAFQSFTGSQNAKGADLRDGLGAALSLPCARMQVLFDPETTTLQLTGHVPDASQSGPIVAALQAQVGADIAVTENLLVLPAPQCGALSGIASVGLPQSTDQITNPLIVGADTHALAFRYVAGEALVMDLTAPDYPAFVYVDYFDADGNVIHLSPNDVTPLQEVTPKSALRIGAKTQQEEGLFVTIGPPYGQEIAAAFASSVPLYSGTRPLVEPAGPYLAWLQEQVTAARAQHADFKGEWVYFFVTTAAN